MLSTTYDAALLAAATAPALTSMYVILAEPQLDKRVPGSHVRFFEKPLRGPPRPTEPQNPPSNKKSPKTPKSLRIRYFPQSKRYFPKSTRYLPKSKRLSIFREF